MSIPAPPKEADFRSRPEEKKTAWGAPAAAPAPGGAAADHAAHWRINDEKFFAAQDGKTGRSLARQRAEHLRHTSSTSLVSLISEHHHFDQMELMAAKSKGICATLCLYFLHFRRLNFSVRQIFALFRTAAFKTALNAIEDKRSMLGPALVTTGISRDPAYVKAWGGLPFTAVSAAGADLKREAKGK